MSICTRSSAKRSAGAHLFLQRLHEGVVAGGQHEAEAMIAPTREARREPVRAIFQEVDGGLHALSRMGMDARATVQNPIDGGEADAGGPGDILKRGTRHEKSLQRLIIAAAQRMQLAAGPARNPAEIPARGALQI